MKQNVHTLQILGISLILKNYILKKVFLCSDAVVL
jgi:hypothetical protein